MTEVDGNAVTLYFFFENIVDAEKVLKSSTLANRQFSKHCLTAIQFYSHLLTSPRASMLSLYEGQVLFSTRLQAFSDSHSRSTPYGEALNLALSCGKIRAYAVLLLKGAEIRVRVEFDDVSAAARAVRLYGHNVGGHRYRVSLRCRVFLHSCLSSDFSTITEHSSIYAKLLPCRLSSSPTSFCRLFKATRFCDAARF